MLVTFVGGNYKYMHSSNSPSSDRLGTDRRVTSANKVIRLLVNNFKIYMSGKLYSYSQILIKITSFRHSPHDCHCRILWYSLWTSPVSELWYFYMVRHSWRSSFHKWWLPGMGCFVFPPNRGQDCLCCWWTGCYESNL